MRIVLLLSVAFNLALVASLFIAASGIYLGINARGTPGNNVLLLLAGSVIANSSGRSR